MIVKKTVFAEMVGTTTANISMALKRGKIEANEDGFIDTDNPKNMIYLAERRQKGKAPVVVGIRKRKPKKAPEALPVVGGDALRPFRHRQNPVSVKSEGMDPLNVRDPNIDLPDDPEDGEVFDQIDKIAAEIRYKNIMTKRNELKFEQDKGRVIQTELIERMAAKLNNEIKIRFQDLPSRIIPRLMAMARSGLDDKEIQITLEREIDDGLEAIKLALGEKNG